MTDNFHRIQRLLTFESMDDFYHLQIIKRKKENPDLGSNNHVIKTYYIRMNEDGTNTLDKYKDEIMNLCKWNNARAYINLNVRSFEKANLMMIKALADNVLNKNFRAARNAFDTVAGRMKGSRDKTWVIDIDWDDLEFSGEGLQEEINEISNVIWNLQKETGRHPMVEEIPTRNGLHLITRPFNLQRFSELYPKIDVHKNNPTILYIY